MSGQASFRTRGGCRHNCAETTRPSYCIIALAKGHKGIGGNKGACPRSLAKRLDLRPCMATYGVRRPFESAHNRPKKGGSGAPGRELRRGAAGARSRAWESPNLNPASWRPESRGECPTHIGGGIARTAGVAALSTGELSSHSGTRGAVGVHTRQGPNASSAPSQAKTNESRWASGTRCNVRQKLREVRVALAAHSGKITLYGDQPIRLERYRED